VKVSAPSSTAEVKNTSSFQPSLKRIIPCWKDWTTQKQRTTSLSESTRRRDLTQPSTDTRRQTKEMERNASGTTGLYGARDRILETVCVGGIDLPQGSEVHREEYCTSLFFPYVRVL
jgi:hypothetical protein